MIDGGLSHTALRCQGAHLIVGEVTGMIAERTTATMAAHDGLTADVEGIVEALLAAMTEIDEDTQTVHLTDHLFTEGTHTVVGVAATG